MAFSRKIRRFRKTWGWNVFFSHAEAEAIGGGHLAIAVALEGVVPTKVAVIIAAGGLAWKAVCAAGGHDGVKAVVWLFPSSVILLPR